MTSAVLVEGVHVSFGDVHALAGVDLDVVSGSTLGVLGHNGAGKTSLIHVLTTLLIPDAGRASIDGYDAVTEADRVRRRIGVTGQFAGLDEFLTGRENLEFMARLAGGADRLSVRVGDLIDRLSLGDIANRRVGELSGGSRRRIDLAVSIVASPSVLFLDEPTTGLDPLARAALWDTVEELNDNGTTVLLTTQYLPEADRLANDIVVLDHGRVAARGTPADLKRLAGGKVVTAALPTDEVALLERAPDEVRSVDAAYSNISYSIPDAAAAAELVARLSTDGLGLVDLGITSPTLDDVFNHLLEGIHT